MNSHWAARQLGVRVETKTSDSIFVQLVLVLHYSPLAPAKIEHDFHVSDDVGWNIAAAVFDTVDPLVEAIKVDDLLVMKTAIAADVKAKIGPVMVDLGLGILSTLVGDIRMRSTRDRLMYPVPCFEPVASPELRVGKPRTRNGHVTRQLDERIWANFEKAIHYGKLRPSR